MTIERRELEVAGLKAHFYSPAGGGKFPTVIAIHGGGWRLLNLDNYRYLGPWLAERGYALLAVTHRLATPERKTYPEAVDDVRAALRFARTDAKLGIDAERIALMGDSSGAHLAALVGLTERDRKSTRLNSSHEWISYAVFCLKKKKKNKIEDT